MGKEGNQAASFSDYAIPNFKGLRRLIFWHGRRFGNRAVTFLILNLFKSILYVTPNLYFNMTNGWSGHALQIELYYAIYYVLTTIFVSAGFLTFDQDVTFNINKYVDDAEPLTEFEKAQANSKENFNKSPYFSLPQYFTPSIFDRK